MKIATKVIISFSMAIIMFLSVSIVPASAAEDTWMAKAPMLEAKVYMSTAEMDGKIYIFGGRNASSTTIAKVEEYNTVTDTWTSKADMPTAREFAGAVAIAGKIYVFGGAVNGGSYLSKVEAYDPATNTWSTKTPMPYPQAMFGVSEINGKAYILGGAKSPKQVLVYDPVTDSWSTKSDIPTYIKSYKSVAVNGKIYTFGTDTVMYDPVTDSWTPKASPPVYVDGRGLASANEKIYIIGGYVSSSNSYTNEVYEYDPSADTWTARASMSTKRNSVEAITVNGFIYVMGGYNSFFLSNVEMYAPPAPVLPIAPINLTATGGNTKVDLAWSAVTNVAGYNIKRSTTKNGPYTTIATGVTDVTYTDTDVTNGMTYYYTVTAVNAGGESAHSNEASATPQAPASTGRAILTITLVHGIEKEYDLSMSEVDAFISWYDAKADGTGSARYTMDDPHAKGPFQSRKDHIIFDKIITFDVDEYIQEN